MGRVPGEESFGSQGVTKSRGSKEGKERGSQRGGKRNKENEEDFAEGKKKVMELEWKRKLKGLPKKKKVLEDMRACNGRKLEINLKKYSIVTV